ncbi:MAG TPA: GntR family transcriptional regulator [Spirochaetia bacterium]|nr:GntR family transcriptional regulator [Spirochaetia bacterium]
MLVREPVYQQLSSALKQMLISGEHKVGDKFLTEREICQRFAVSRTTANKAISNMVSEGVLEFKKGIGTFVRTLPLDYDLRSLVSFTRKAREAGRVPGTTLLAFEEKTAGSVEVEVKDRLKVGPSDRVFFCRRLRLADGIPMIVERRYLVARLCEGITEEDLRGSIYSFLTEKKGVKITGSEELIRAVNISPKDAEQLQCKPGQAGFLMLSTGYAEHGIPVWFAGILYRGDCYELRNKLDAQQPSSFAGTIIYTPARS